MEFPKKDLNVALDSLANALFDVRSQLFYKLILETSCKTSELSEIKIKDIDSNKIKFGKRSVQISEELSKLLFRFIKTNHLESDCFLFSTRQSEKISPKRIRQIIHQTSQEKLGYKIEPKDLRKYSIQNKLKSKNTIEVKKEAGLKRLDKRKFLSNEQIIQLENNIKDNRTSLIFKLLLNNYKSSEIVNFKVEDILDSSIPKKIVDELENYAIKNRVSFGEYLFKTQKNTHLSKVMIFKIIKNLGKISGTDVNPQILNNTSIANALSSEDSESRLKALGVKTKAFHLQGGFYNE